MTRGPFGSGDGDWAIVPPAAIRAATASPAKKRIFLPFLSEHRWAPEPAEHGAQHDHQIEPDRPIVDVIEIELDAAPRLGLVADAAAHAVDLAPAGDARLDPVARGIFG